MAKRFSYIILILSILFFLIIIFIIRESEFTSTAVKDVTVTSCSFFTLILAILLYDRFDYRKVVFQKKLDIILSLLVDLKSSTFYVKYIRPNRTEFHAAFNIDRKSLNKNIEFSDKLISFDKSYHDIFYRKIWPYFNNPFLPKEISESLQFLTMANRHSINHLTDIDVMKLSYDDESYSTLENIFSTENNLWYIESSETITLKNYTNNYINCLNIIEGWIDKHSNIKVDLNI